MPRLPLFVACGSLLPLAVVAGPPQLVRDINTQPEAVSSAPADLHDQGSWLFFTAFDGGSRTPWATDGSAAGTVRLADIAMPTLPPIGGPLPPSPAVRVGSLTFFFAQGVPWVTDGTPAGTHELQPAFAGAAPVGEVNGFFLFTIGQNPQEREVWSTDGTASVLLATIDAGFPTGELQLAIVGERLYFLAADPSGVTTPWVSDGTPAGTRRLPIPLPGNEQSPISNVAVVGDYVLFAATTDDFGRELWRIETANNDHVELVADIAPGYLDGVAAERIDAVGATAVFTGTPDGIEGALWRSNGTAPGTAEVSNILPVDPLASDPYIGPTASGRLLFRTPDANGRFDLWGTDGTIAGTVRVATGIDFIDVGVVGDHYYYALYSATGAQLWRTDGAAAATPMTGLPGSNAASYEVAGDETALYARVVQASMTTEESAIRVVKYDLTADVATDLKVYAGVAYDDDEPRLFRVARGTLYFDARDGARTGSGRELWRSDGTLAGTQLVRNITPEIGNASSAPGSFVAYQDRLYFAADDGIHGRELWRSDATSAGTALVLDLHPGPGSSEPQDAFVVGSRLLFFARDTVGLDGYRLWATDGTGTQLLTPALTPPTLAQLSQWWTSKAPCGPFTVSIGSLTYFRAAGGGAGWALWRTDGTPGGTVQVGPSFASPLCWLTAFDGRIYFGADAGNGSGAELWRYDPALDDANFVADLWPGAQGSAPARLTVLNGRLLFGASNAQSPASKDLKLEQLWQSDGTAAGTSALTSFTWFSSIEGVQRVGSRVVFGAPEGLWASDGTLAGTGRVGTVPFGAPFVFDATLPLSSGVLFVSTAGMREYAPWITDGTLAGTYLLRKVAPTSEREVFTDFNGVAVFNGDDGTDERLWRTDGTPAGTTPVGGSGLGAPAAASIPTRLAAGQRFFYVSNEGNVGTELFAFSNDAPLAFGDSATGESAAAVTIAVLANDADADGALDASSVRITLAPANGTAQVQASGAIIYTSNASFTGTDTFSYTVADTQRAVSHPAVVEVAVTAPPPITPPSTTPPSMTPSPSTPPTPSPVPPASGGGGGALGWGAALMLLVALSHRRRRTGRGRARSS